MAVIYAETTPRNAQDYCSCEDERVQYVYRVNDRPLQKTGHDCFWADVYPYWQMKGHRMTKTDIRAVEKEPPGLWPDDPSNPQ